MVRQHDFSSKNLPFTMVHDSVYSSVHLANNNFKNSDTDDFNDTDEVPAANKDIAIDDDNHPSLTRVRAHADEGAGVAVAAAAVSLVGGRGVRVVRQAGRARRARDARHLARYLQADLANTQVGALGQFC